MLSRQTFLSALGLGVLGAAVFFTARARIIDQAPKTVMEKIQTRIAAGAGGWNACNHNRVYGPREAAARRANPDSIITSMAYDVTDGPVSISGEVWPDYWSLSLYQQNSDNYFVINDTQLGAKTFEYVIISPGQDSPGPNHIVSPTDKGIMLIRRFATSAADMPAVTANQDALHCGPQRAG